MGDIGLSRAYKEDLTVYQEFLLRVKQAKKPEIFVGRRYGQFAKMHKKLRLELPGKVIPPLPRKNKHHAIMATTGDDDDAESVSSVDTQTTNGDDGGGGSGGGGGLRGYLGLGSSHNRRTSRTSLHDSRRRSTSRGGDREHVTLYREDQRVTLRAFLRTLLQNEQIANSKAMTDFLTHNPITLNEEEMEYARTSKSVVILNTLTFYTGTLNGAGPWTSGDSKNRSSFTK